MRLIYAEEFKEKILAVRDAIPRTVPLEQYEFGSKPYRDGDLMRGGIRKALRCLEETPTIDAEPVIHAHWIKMSTGDVCSRCKHSTGRHGTISNYCPECGARMDGGDIE